MSALRLSRPGLPTTFVDLGPDSPHKPKGAIPGGVLVVAESERTRDQRLQRAWNAAKRIRCRDEACGRPAGHMGRHMTPERIAAVAYERPW